MIWYDVFKVGKLQIESCQFIQIELWWIVEWAKGIVKSDRRNVFGLLQNFISRIEILKWVECFFNWAHAYELNGLQNVDVYQI